jgi:hypothetical protein
MVSFKVAAKTSLTADEIVNGMLEQSNWTSFKGAGLVPGIEEVEIIVSDNELTGTVFKVKNSDGSHHEETIIDYKPSEYLVMKLHKFSSPLNKFATHFHETWTFDHQNNATYFERAFELYPKNFFGKILLPTVAMFFKKGVESHTETIVNTNSSGESKIQNSDD